MWKNEMEFNQPLMMHILYMCSGFNAAYANLQVYLIHQKLYCIVNGDDLLDNVTKQWYEID
jgi:hypothetical protein